MRERGLNHVVSGRGRSSPSAARDPRRSGSPDSNVWQIIAIIALIAATAGWTTVAVLALRPGPSAVAEAPSESFEPEPTDDTEVPPVADTHDAPELEALLPTELDGTPLQVAELERRRDPDRRRLEHVDDRFLTAAGKTRPTSRWPRRTTRPRRSTQRRASTRWTASTATAMRDASSRPGRATSRT